MTAGTPSTRRNCARSGGTPGICSPTASPPRSSGTRPARGGGSRSSTRTRPTRPTTRRSTPPGRRRSRSPARSASPMSHTPTILVTGAAGFAGSHLLDALRLDGARVVALRKPGVGADAQAAYPDADWREIDLLDRDAMRRVVADTGPDAVYHLAGAPHVGQSWSAATETLAVNVLGTHLLLEAIRLEGVPSRVVVPSSAYVYRAMDRALTEDDAVEATNPYAISKVATELEVA